MEAPVAIEVRALSKTFRIPAHRVDTLKERVAHPFSRAEYRMLHALRDVSFDVRKGEFFGIVGQNGSGKSTLLKILASIYRADAGRVRMAGTLAPFIELGVGFDPELTARENIVINGVLMGLTKREARRRLDAVIEFSELEDFAELKLKNYSSGMMVRLAFAVMVQADADVMLVDEVLAVGDAAFAQKCMDVFHARRDAGKTIVLVTHDMPTVQQMCHRALVLHEGDCVYDGDPEQASLRYLRLNFGGTAGGEGLAEVPDLHTRVVHAQLLDADGRRADNVEQGQPIVVDLVFEARRELVDPEFVLQVGSDDGIVFGFKRSLGGGRSTVAAGEHVRVRGRIENTLRPGTYSLACWVRRARSGGDLAVQGLRLLDFVVYGTDQGPGVVTVQTDVEAVPE